MTYTETKDDEPSDGNSVVHELLSDKTAELSGNGALLFRNRHPKRWVAGLEGDKTGLDELSRDECQKCGVSYCKNNAEYRYR
jgi:hypothetical protein